MMAKKKKLNTKQKLWADYWLSNGFNKSLAAKQAEYKAKSDAGFRKIGWENSTKPHIQAYISERLEDVAMGANEVLARIASIAEGFDPLDYIEQKETFGIDKKGKQYFAGYDLKIDTDKLQENGYGHLIKSIRQTPKGPHIIWHDTLAALITLAKHHKLLTDKLDLGGDLAITTSTPDAVKALQEARKEMGGG